MKDRTSNIRKHQKTTHRHLWIMISYHNLFLLIEHVQHNSNNYALNRRLHWEDGFYQIVPNTLCYALARWRHQFNSSIFYIQNIPHKRLYATHFTSICISILIYLCMNSKLYPSTLPIVSFPENGWGHICTLEKQLFL